MELEGVKIGFVFTGAFYMFSKTIPKLKNLVHEKAIIIPIMSYNTYKNATGQAKDCIEEIEHITHKKIIHNIKDVEPIGRKNMTDIMVVAPCTRKYYFKTCVRYNRYNSDISGKISFT